MARERMMSILLAAAIGGGFALATATMATAETEMPTALAVVSGPYPPGPVNNNNNNNGADPSDPSDPWDPNFDCDDDGGCCDSSSCCGGGGCRGTVEKTGPELPFTGAPVAAVATLGGGLLAAGTATTAIAARRRRSTSAL
ncbi:MULTISPECIES: hypothetical protein [Streptosporangium]|uniref:Gram-positive cocci surface proteins LPxTG domain-containing protein n=1 Tax=Streptosporangium brasiliense TaxID=47480 RepID=A0ABT9RCF4_9ACTN|nr:hypothetical protein [Streptosporangium brasiliense]MDP9866828.1 hypothetical protein [Streptosporangium brasiliense]